MSAGPAARREPPRGQASGHLVGIGMESYGWIRGFLAASSRHTEREHPMSKTAQKMIGDIAPKLAQLTDEVLFEDVWERPQLSKRDRSLITCAALVATGKTEQMSFHFPRAIENGVTQDELVEMITQLAFYVGWPSAMSAINKVKELLGNKQP
jgi:4-carboxymuconolactone decarboxylase